jgi:hypothetical protein
VLRRTSAPRPPSPASPSSRGSARTPAQRLRPPAVLVAVVEQIAQLWCYVRREQARVVRRHCSTCCRTAAAASSVRRSG